MLLRVLLLLLVASPAFAQLGQSESVRSDLRACAYSKFLATYLDSLSDEELINSVREQQAQYSRFVETNGAPISKQEYRLRKKIERDFQALARARAPRTVLQNAAQSLCTVAISTGGTLLHEAGLAASLVTSAFTFPLRFTAKFGIGLFTRDVEHKRGPSYAQFTGAGWSGNLISVLYQSYRVAFTSGSPYMLALYGVTAIDMAMEEHCRGDAPISERARRFCNGYEKLKRVEYDGTEAGRRAGAHISKKVLITADFRDDQAANPRLCQKHFKKQIRIGKRARFRLLDRLARYGLKEATVSVLPPDFGGCVGLRIGNLSEAERSYLEENDTGFTDGIPQVYQLKEGAKTEPSPTPVPSPTPDISTDEAVCRAVYQAQVGDFVTKPEDFRIKTEIVQMTLSPARFGKLADEEVITPEEKLIAKTAGRIGSGKNIILIMAPSESQLTEYEAVLPRLEELNAELAEQNAKLKWLKKSRNYETCMARQKEVEFDFTKFKEVANAVKQITVAKRVEEFRAMMKKANKAGHKLFGLRHVFKLDWEIVEMTSLNVLRDTLADPELLNLIVVTHGNENGKIVDSRFNELANSAFEWIQPNLQSISFFSCHSVEAPKTYALNERLLATPSYHQVRVVNHVISSDLLEELNEAPVLALNTYIEAVDRAAYRLLLGNARVQMAFASRMKTLPPSSGQCSVGFDGLVVSKGAFSLKLNQHWVGTVYAGEGSPTLSLPCDWVDGAEFKAVLESTSLTDQPVLQSSKVILKVRGRHGEVEWRDPVAKVREDGSISRLTWSRH